MSCALRLAVAALLGCFLSAIEGARVCLGENCARAAAADQLAAEVAAKPVAAAGGGRAPAAAAAAGAAVAEAAAAAPPSVAAEKEVSSQGGAPVAALELSEQTDGQSGNCPGKTISGDVRNCGTGPRALTVVVKEHCNMGQGSCQVGDGRCSSGCKERPMWWWPWGKTKCCFPREEEKTIYDVPPGRQLGLNSQCKVLATTISCR